MGNNCIETQVQRTYTVEEIAQILGISTRKAYDFCSKTSDFKVLHIGKRCIRVHRESFENWFASLSEKHI